MPTDLRHALRLLRRRPAFAVTAVLTLALGIGLPTTIFTVVYGVLFKPLPVAEDDRVVGVLQTMPSLGRWRDAVSGVRFEEWQARTEVFAALSAANQRPFDLLLERGAERVDGEAVSGSFFELLGVQAVRGRVLAGWDDQPAEVVPCVISESLWRQHFGTGSDVLGRGITASGMSLTVVGVVGDDFARWRQGASIWVPYKRAPALIPPATFNNDGYHLFQVLARLRPGVTRNQARASLSNLDARLDELFGGADPNRDIEIVPLRDLTVDAPLRRSLWILAVTAALVLILACANVGSQIVAQGVSRRREMATRAALGGSVLRLTVQTLTETSVLAIAGCGIGLLLAAWMVPVLIAAAPPEVRRLSASALERPSWVFALLSTVLVSVALGMLPAIRLGRDDVVDDLRGASTATPAATSIRAYVLLAMGQMSLAMPVVVAATLLAASFIRLQAIDPGFDPRPLLKMTLTLPAASYGTTEAVRAFHDRVIARTSALPGVQAVAIGQDPVDYLTNLSAAGVSITIEGGRRYLNADSGQAPFTPGRRRVTSTYFRALGLSLVAGRPFTDADRAEAPLVAVINESRARLHWPGQSALGKRINFEPVRPGRPLREPWTEIVGVVGDARQHRFEAAPRPEIYTPLSQASYPVSTSTLLVRSAVAPADLALPVRRAIRELDIAVPVYQMRTMTSVIDEATAPQRYAARLVGLFGLLAVALAGVGVYGLAALAAAQRAREIGIRVALGATRSDVRRLVFVQALGPAAAGVALGTLGAVFATRLLDALLYEISPSDPLMFALAIGVLLGAAACASFLPAGRASRADPAVVLRPE